MDTVGYIMGEAEQVLQHPSASSRDLDWRSPVPAEDSTTRLIPLTKGQFAIVDAADFESLSKWKWHAWFNKTGNTWYARRSVFIGGKGVVLMHRQIMNAEKGTLVDHRDHNGLNNSRSNLRKATRSQNMQNRGAQINNKSGYKGVSWDKKRSKWQAQIECARVKIHLGFFTDKKAAAKVYQEKAIELHGDFSNFSVQKAGQ
jgi:hypothetical protein